jgi:hypothetical protein
MRKFGALFQVNRMRYFCALWYSFALLFKEDVLEILIFQRQLDFRSYCIKSNPLIVVWWS